MPVEYPKRIYIFGASGSGVSTLGKNIAKELSLPWFDCDTYYWKKTDPPFTEAHPIEVRKELIREAISPHNEWVISGSFLRWGDEIVDQFDCALYLHAPPKVRVWRVKERERLRFGSRILEGGDMHDGHKIFIDWVAQYDDGLMGGRSASKHAEWMKTFSCPVYKIDSNIPESELVARSLSLLKN